MALSCVIVDDNRVFLRAAQDLLESGGISVVGLASTGTEARRQCRVLRPDVALVDIDLGGESGFDVARELAGGQADQPPQVILISAHAGQDYAGLVAASPALGFLPKPDLSAAGIRSILVGGEQADAAP